MQDSFTPKQVAQAIGVSESSLKRWCDRGSLCVQRTAGGHRRIPLAEVIRFLRESGQELVRPDLLGLPKLVGQTTRCHQRSCTELEQALVAGDEEKCRTLVANLYTAGHSAADICDKVLAPAMRIMGDCWSRGEVEVYHERRGCEICVAVLHELRRVVPCPGSDAPTAMGGSLSGDFYMLATLMVEIALREAGWRAESYGTNLPAEAFVQLVETRKPALVWVSVSHIPDLPPFIEEYAQIHQAAQRHRIPLIVGGRALDPDVRRQLKYCAFCDTLAHAVSFAGTLHPGAGARA